jgi:hypothetical protein
MQKVGNRVYGILNVFFFSKFLVWVHEVAENVNCTPFVCFIYLHSYLHFPGGFQCYTPLSLPLPVCTPDWNDKCIKKLPFTLNFIHDSFFEQFLQVEVINTNHCFKQKHLNPTTIYIIC